jgi:hypothetical protein
MQYAPDTVGMRKQSRWMQQTTNQGLYDTESQIVGMNNRRARYSNLNLYVGASPETSMRYVIMIKHKPATCLISSL